MSARGKRLLVVEDNGLLAMQLVDSLGDAGYLVVGPFPSVERGLAAAREEPLDGAVLDVHIRGGDCGPIARELERRGIPFLFITGYSEPMVVARPRAHLRKPVTEDVLLANVAALWSPED